MFFIQANPSKISKDITDEQITKLLDDYRGYEHRLGCDYISVLKERAKDDKVISKCEDAWIRAYRREEEYC